MATDERGEDRRGELLSVRLLGALLHGRGGPGVIRREFGDAGLRPAVGEARERVAQIVPH